MQRSSTGHEHRSKLGIFIDEQGATSVERLLKWATAHESLRTTFLSDTENRASWSRNQVESNRATPPRNFQKHVQLLVQLNISAGCVPAC